MRKLLITAAAGLLACLSGQISLASTASPADQPAGQLVSENPANFTPHVLDGRVYSVVQVGDTVVLGGAFSRVRDDDSQTALSRSNLVAFDAQTGEISSSFTPDSNGTVNVVIPAGDGETVYVGGSFSRIDDELAQNLARVRVSDGEVINSFDGGSPTGVVKDLRLQNGRLWVAGAFTHIHGRHQPALATLDPDTGSFDPFMHLRIDGVHNGGYTAVVKLDVNPQGTRLVGIGNFDTLDGVKNHQLFMLDTTGGSAQQASFQTGFYETRCSLSFDSYMRDLDFAPDGSFFVVSTTGAYGGSTGACDQTARWETDSSGASPDPSWVDYTGGDTTYAVEITDSAVYVGGHQRWQNNPFAGDRPGPGAVSRPGIAALDPANGLPFSWNPTRTRGVGVFDMLSTAQGLWLASDTDRIGNWEYHGRIALMPADGKQVEALRKPQLPNDIYAAGSLGPTPDPSVLYRVNAAGPEVPASTGPAWAADTSGSPTLYNNGSGNRASWDGVGSLDSTVPEGTPGALFNSELWDPNGGQEMHWSFPVPADTPIEVRLYFSNQCTCTENVGERVFDVTLDGTMVLDDFDIVEQVGHQVATMRSFETDSDGAVDIDLTHVTENPLINAIEIVRTDIDPTEPSTGDIVRRSYRSGEVGPTMSVPSGDLPWNSVRGATMINGSLYMARSNGSFAKRAFDGSAYGSSESVDTSDQIVSLAAWHDDASQVTGMFFDSGRIYFTRAGSSELYYRYFTPESGVVGAKRFVASSNVAGIDFSQVRGMFVTPSKLFWATPNGNLHSIDWNDGPIHGAPSPGSAQVVSGPDTDALDWASRALFLHQGEGGQGAPMPSTASFTTDCTSTACNFDASDSNAPGSSIASYEWDFGDGSTGTGVSASHEFGSSGTYTVELTVTTSDGGTSTTSQELTVEHVNQDPSAAFSVSCDGRDCSFDGSGSSDQEGPIASYVWEFGDGKGGSGRTASHTFSDFGTFEVTLTVTDGQGASTSATQKVEVSEPVSSSVSFVAANSANGNHRTHSVQIPQEVQAGDILVLFMARNTDSVTVDGPVGWDELETVEQGNFGSHAWTRRATTDDAGTQLEVQTSGYTKADLTVAAYRGNGGVAQVVASAKAYERRPSEVMTSPQVQVGQAGSWVVSYWGVKSTDGVTAPTGQTERSVSAGSGGGPVSAAMADSGGPVDTGTRGGLDADLADSGSHGAAYTLILDVAGDDGGGDDGGSDDGGGDDGGGDDGGGDDGGGDDGGGDDGGVSLGFVGANSQNGNERAHEVRIPADVQAGDTLVFFMAHNTDSVAVDGPTGWDEVEAVEQGNFGSHAWTRQAMAGDAGTQVEVQLSGYTKADLTVAAYRASGGESSQVTVSASAYERRPSAGMSTPQVDVEEPGWLVSYWGVKGTASVTPPAGQEERASSEGSGGGRISAALADSDGAVATGQGGGLTANLSDGGSNAAAYTLLIGLTNSGDDGGSGDGGGSGGGDGGGDGDVALGFVGAESTNGNRVIHSAQVPAGVEVSDTLVMFLTINNGSREITAGPEGWSQVEALDENGIRGRVWTKTAGVGDAGATVTAQSSGWSKSDVTVVAYRSEPEATVVASAQEYVRGGETELTTPQVTINRSGAWVVSYWGAKSTEGNWSLPGAQQQRSTSDGGGGGRVDALLADSDGPVATGTRGGVTATVDNAASRAAMFSLVIAND